MTLLCTLGDVLLDVVVATGPQLAHGADTPSATMVTAGGQAANVAAWTIELGGHARVVAKRARDLAGCLVAGDLRRRGVEVAGPVTDGTTGVVVSLSDGGGERTMLTDRGVCPLLSAAELRDEWFAGCDRLHLPLYSLVNAPIRDAAFRAARLVPRLSVDLSSVSVLREIGTAEVDRMLGLLRPDMILGNEPEIRLAAVAGTATVVEKTVTVIEKLGSGGVRCDGKTWPAHPARRPTAPAPGTRSPPGSCSAGWTSGSRPLPVR